MGTLKEFIRNRKEIEKIAINVEFGGFALKQELAESMGLNEKEDAYFFSKNRNNPVLIDAIEKIKPDYLEIVEVEWGDIPRAYLKNYDGKESIVYSYDDFCYPLMDYLCGIED